MTDIDPHGMPPDEYTKMPRWWVARSALEWRNRTAFGKLTFPLWVLMWACAWVFALPFGEVVYRWKWLIHHLSRLKPASHKEEANGDD